MLKKRFIVYAFDIEDLNDLFVAFTIDFRKERNRF